MADPALVQTPADPFTGGTAGADHTDTAFETPNAEGNLLLCFSTWDNTITNEGGPSDSQENTWQQAAFANDPAGQCAGIWYAENCKAGDNSVTFRYGPDLDATVTFRSMIIAEYSGLAVANSLDGGHGQVVSMAGDTDDGEAGEWTTEADGDLLVALCERYNNRTISAGTGFTLRAFTSGATDYEFSFEDALQAVAGAANPTFTASGSTNGIIVGAAFKRPAAGGGGISIALPTAVETNQARAVAASKARALPKAVELNAAGALVAAKARSLPPAREGNTTGRITAAKSLSLPVAHETDTGRAIPAGKARSLPTAQESDRAGLLLPSKLRPLPTAFEVDAAGRISPAGAALPEPGDITLQAVLGSDIRLTDTASSIEVITA